MQKIVIPLSKSKIVFLLAASVSFVLVGVWLFGMDAAEIASGRRFDNPIVVHGIGLVSMLFGGLCAFAIARKLIDPAPGLVLDARGLTDNTSALSAGFIPWSDIIGFEVRRIQRQRILYVLLDDPHAFVSKFGPIKRMLLKANMRMSSSPVAITSNALSISFDELTALVERHFAASRRGD